MEGEKEMEHSKWSGSNFHSASEKRRERDRKIDFLCNTRESG